MSDLQVLLARLPAMKRRFETACASYEELAARAGSRVAWTQWSAKPLHSPFPFGIERERGQAPGKPMKTAPQRIAGKWFHGVAEDGSVALIHEFVPEQGQRYEEYWEHRADRIDTTLFDYYEPASNVLNVQRVEFLNGRPATFLRYARHGVRAEVYRYTDARLSQIDGAAKEHNAAGGPIFTTDHLHYEDGRLERVVRTWAESGISERIYPTSGR
jgi:hypothetical protein